MTHLHALLFASAAVFTGTAFSASAGDKPCTVIRGAVAGEHADIALTERGGCNRVDAAIVARYGELNFESTADGADLTIYGATEHNDITVRSDVNRKTATLFLVRCPNRRAAEIATSDDRAILDCNAPDKGQ